MAALKGKKLSLVTSIMNIMEKKEEAQMDDGFLSRKFDYLCDLEEKTLKLIFEGLKEQ